MSGGEYRPRIVRADTPLYNLTAVWYGPGGNLPPARYTAWLFGLTVTFASALILLAVVPMHLLPRLIMVAGVAPMIGWFATRNVFAHIDGYQPLRAWRQTLAAELDTPRPARPRTTTTVARPARIVRS